MMWYTIFIMNLNLVEMFLAISMYLSSFHHIHEPTLVFTFTVQNEPLGITYYVSLYPNDPKRWLQRGDSPDQLQTTYYLLATIFPSSFCLHTSCSCHVTFAVLDWALGLTIGMHQIISQSPYTPFTSLNAWIQKFIILPATNSDFGPHKIEI